MWSLAFRNIWRDSRRSAVTMLSMALGAMGVLLFLGYVQFVERTLSAVVIYRQGNGHVQVYKKDALAHLATEPEKFSIDEKAQQRVREIASKLPGVMLVTPQMEGVGIIQNNDRTAVFLAEGVVPEDDRKIRQAGDAAVGTGMDDFASGTALQNGKPSLWLTKQLKQVLDLKPASKGELPYIQLAGIGFDRRLNASDADVVGEFSTSIEETENKSIKVPLTLLQDLYRTKSVSRMVVVLSDRDLAPGASAQLQQKLDAELPGYEVTTWKHPAIGKLYESVMGFMGAVFAFTGLIVLLVCVLTIQNTINISVLERVRELGTLRAMGFGKSRLGGLFGREAFLLASLGAVAGIIVTAVIAFVLTQVNFTTTLPRLSMPVPVKVQLGATGVVAVLIIGGLMATWISYRSAKKRLKGQIVDAFQTRLLVLAVFASCAALGLGVSPVHAAPSRETPAASAAQPAGAPTVDQLREWIRTSDLARGGYGAYTWNLTITSEEPSGRTETSYRVDVKGDKALAYTLTPASSKGELVLLHARSMWFMKPGLRKPVSISPRQRLSGEAANGDIASAQFADNYDPTLVGEDTVNGRAVYKVRLVAKTKDVTYDQAIFYLDKENHLALKAEYLTTSGTPFKYSLMKYGNKTPEKNAPFISELKIIDSKYTNQHSTLVYADLKSANHPDSLFNLANLGR